MKTKTIKFRAHPDGDWMSMGRSHVQPGSFTVPEGMELDTRAGQMRWKPNTPENKRDFEKREITFEYLTQEEANPPTQDDLRRAAYIEAGVTTDAMVVALWEKLVEGNDTKSIDLQGIREAIKLETS